MTGHWIVAMKIFLAASFRKFLTFQDLDSFPFERVFPSLDEFHIWFWRIEGGHVYAADLGTRTVQMHVTHLKGSSLWC